jgi:serine/threonine protein kinase
MEKYKILGNIGEGAHGIVYKAKNRQTGCLCALKKVALRKIEQQGFPVKVFREIKVLQHIRDVGENVEQTEKTESLDSKYLKSGMKLSQIKISSAENGQKSKKPSKSHPDKSPNVSDLFLTSGGNYIIFLQEAFSHGTGFILSFDYMISDLSEVIRSHPTPLTIPETKSYMIQITRGLQVIHKSQFLHRDLKPSNILISNKGQIKIGDFGLARIFSNQQQNKFELKYKSGDKKYRKLDLLQYSHQVATRWYRAPELLFGAKIRQRHRRLGLGHHFRGIIHEKPNLQRGHRYRTNMLRHQSARHPT